MQEGQLYREALWSGAAQNIEGDPPDSTRMQGAAFVTDGTIIYYGDEAPLDFLESLHILNGVSAAEVDHLTPGYLHSFNFNDKKLTVRNGMGNTIEVRDIKNFADMKIDMAIAQSHQFKIIVDTDTLERTGYVIGSRVLPRREADQSRETIYIEQGSPSLDINEITNYATKLADTVKAETGERQLTYRGNDALRDALEAGEQYIDRTIKPDERWKLAYMWENTYNYKEEMNVFYTAAGKIATMLYAKMQDLSADGFFTINLINREKEFPATRYRKQWRGQMMPVGDYLMIYAFAAGNLMGSQPVVEPWMLWEMWRWLGKGNTVYLEDKIFDISPNWGR